MNILPWKWINNQIKEPVKTFLGINSYFNGSPDDLITDSFGTVQIIMIRNLNITRKILQTLTTIMDQQNGCCDN